MAHTIHREIDMDVIYRQDNIKIFRDKKQDVFLNIYGDKVSYVDDLEEDNSLIMSIRFDYWLWKEFAKAIAYEEIYEFKTKLVDLINKSEI